MGPTIRNFIRVVVCVGLFAAPNVASAGVIPWLYDAVFGPHYPTAGGYSMYRPTYGMPRPAYRPVFGGWPYAGYQSCVPCASSCSPCGLPSTACATTAGRPVRRADLKPVPDGNSVKQAYEGPRRVESKRMPPTGEPAVQDAPFVESRPIPAKSGESADPDAGFQPPVTARDEKPIIPDKSPAPTKKTPAKSSDAAAEEESKKDDAAFPKLPPESPFDPSAARPRIGRRLSGSRVDRERFRAAPRGSLVAEWLPRPRVGTPTLAAGAAVR